VPFILEILAFHHLTPAGKQFWTHASLIFTIIYAVFVSANYVVQLATVVPAKMRGASDDLLDREQVEGQVAHPDQPNLFELFIHSVRADDNVAARFHIYKRIQCRSIRQI